LDKVPFSGAPAMPTISSRSITRKYATLRRFAGEAVEAALESIRGGRIEVSQYFARLLYFLPFTRRSVEKVLAYAILKASKDPRDPTMYEVGADEVPGFDPGERDNVLAAFKSLCDLDIADAIGADKIKLKAEVIYNVVQPVAPFIAENLDAVRGVRVDDVSYVAKTISGISALYVMYRANRLPSSFTLMMGLLSPTAWVEKDGTINRKTTISYDEWLDARRNMAMLKPLREKFEVEYFKAIGFMYENRIIIGSYPSFEVVGSIVDLVIAPAYKRLYDLRRQRAAARARR
jgi:hypothetical protein